MIAMFILMLFFHILADFPLQGDFMAQAKRPPGRFVLRGNQAELTLVPWWLILLQHCYVHAIFVGALVLFFTADLSVACGLALAEFVLHFTVDRLKGLDRIGFLTDQLLHMGCKLAYAVSLFLWGF